MPCQNSCQMLLRPRPIDTCKSPSRPQIKSGALRASTSPSYCKYTPQPLEKPLEKQVAPGNCIKLGQTHVRLPESGRGAPCGRPSQGITPRTVQIVVRYRKFQTSLATGGRFLGRKKKTIGRGALRRLLWRPNLDAIALKWLRLHLDYKVDGKTGQGGMAGMSPNRTAGRLKWVPKKLDHEPRWFMDCSSPVPWRDRSSGQDAVTTYSATCSILLAAPCFPHFMV